MPNFLENLLPTAGSILGGIGGGIVGGLADPFGGEIAGGIAGAGLGGSLGRMGENALTHQKVLQGNDVTAGLEGAAGQGAGEALGAGLNAGAGLLAKGANKGASGLLQGQFLKGSVDSDTVAAMRDMGITDAKQVGSLAPLSTGANGALNSGVQRGLRETDFGADLSGLNKFGNNLIADNQMQLRGSSIPGVSDKIQKALLNSVNPEDVAQAAVRRSGQQSGGIGDSIKMFAHGSLQNVLPENAFRVTQNFEQLASKAYQGAYNKMGDVISDDQLAKFRIFKGLADESKRAAFGGDTPIPLTEENKAQIIQDLAPMKDVNPQAYNWHVNQITNAQTLQDLRPVQKPMVDASRALGATERSTSTKGGTAAKDVIGSAMATAGLATAGPAGALPGAITMLAGHPAAEKVGSSVLSKVSDLLTNPTMQKVVKEGAPVATDTAATIPSMDLSTPQGGAMQPTAMTGAGGAPGMTASPEALQLMLGLIGLQADPYMAGSFTPMISNAVQPLQKAEAAQGALTGLEGTFNQAGGGVGGAGGLLSRLQAMVPGSAGNLYNRQAGQLEQTLGQLGLPGTAAPSLMSNQPTAGAGFNVLQQVINSLGGNPQTLLAGVPAQ